MSTLPDPCATYQPSKPDPVVCQGCNRKWGDHAPDVRSVFTRIASSTIVSMIEHRAIYTSKARPEPCVAWRPIKYGEDLKVCVCGRLLREHNFKVIINSKHHEQRWNMEIGKPAAEEKKPQCLTRLEINKGMFIMCMEDKGHAGFHKHDGVANYAEWDDAGYKVHRKKFVTRGAPVTLNLTAQSAKPCGQFKPKEGKFGTCEFCLHPYKTHDSWAKGTHIEDIDYFHMPNCKSKSGVKLSCNCMSEEAKQSLLDSAKIWPPLTKTCEEFRQKESGEAGQYNFQLCVCGQPFHRHSLQAKGGVLTWTEWVTAQMTNTQVIEWFVKLGSTPKQRMEKLKPFLEHPSHLTLGAPSPRVLKELYDMLPLSWCKEVEITFPESLRRVVDPSNNANLKVIYCPSCNDQQAISRHATRIVCRKCYAVIGDNNGKWEVVAKAIKIHKPGCLGSAICQCPPDNKVSKVGDSLTEAPKPKISTAQIFGGVTGSDKEQRDTCFSCGAALTVGEMSMCKGCVASNLGDPNWKPNIIPDTPPRHLEDNSRELGKMDWEGPGHNAD